MSEYTNHIVIDNGTCYSKAGYNGENAPRSVIPTVCGRYINSNRILTEDNPKVFIGKDCQNNCVIEQSYPIKNGKITNWDEMEDIWEYIFTEELKVTSEAHSVFLLDSINSSDYDKEKTAEIMFEKFKIFNYHTEPQPIMSLYFTTKTTGLIVESGAGLTQIVPIYEGYILSNSVVVSEVGGEAITRHLMNQITHKLKKYKVYNELEYSRNIKEQLSEISITPLNGEEKLGIEKLYELPDGNKVSLGDELMQAPEGNFNPGLLGKDELGIDDLIIKCVDKMEVTLKKDFYANIVLGGGNTSIKGYAERLKKNIASKISPTLANSLKIYAQPERKYSAWIGASFFCSIGSFQQMWTSKNEYDEHRSILVYKKNYF